MGKLNEEQVKTALAERPDWRREGDRISRTVRLKGFARPLLLANAIGGIVVVYIFGTIGLLLRTDLSVWAAVSTNFAFVPGDLVKVVIATVVAKSVPRAYPGIVPT